MGDVLTTIFRRRENKPSGGQKDNNVVCNGMKNATNTRNLRPLASRKSVNNADDGKRNSAEVIISIINFRYTFPISKRAINS